ncbi:pyruvate carboxylase [Succiniclasticum ruminis]|uniref:Pyruvate carboxylase n=1 Tax=Succiniclasticum ruminis DSM 9236 TaxID=1123323 RepID=A0A1I2CGZ5_9FIRM|nr:pyruvate carboxylase [Succiniclasticum ruminis]SFE67591.1 pyruvate carboxylase [Succiniclasticum ruminis DSM 9236]
MRKIKTVLVANRGEIAIRVFRACNELGIHTIAIFSKEDTLSLHRNKADEAYLVGRGKGPVEAYLDIEDIMRIAHEHDVDAIHPGYGFLSENAELAKRCAEEGFIFIGPRVEHLIMFGDKVNARAQAKLAEIPMIPGSDGPISSVEDVRAFGEKYGYPLLIKAVNGGGGRGMRAVNSPEEVETAYALAKSEALKAFGNDEIYLEKYLKDPKHIEVQILGDEQGEIVHLYERDCSVQRRHQKVVEMAPATFVKPELRQRICDAAVKLMKNVDYISAGTVEFLVTADDEFYFIEVNPRIQVEHTVTEAITGIDIVQSQIRIAEGYGIHSPEVGIPEQDKIGIRGEAIQCRITTEDPLNNFMPDTGKLIAYRSGGGMGIRLDAGNAFTGSVITPYYDSLLVKATTWGLNHTIAVTKMLRCLKEFRIRGVKTNIAFLENLLQHPHFINGTYTTNFLDETPELFHFPEGRDRGTKLLHYIGDITVNGYANVGVVPKPEFAPMNLPKPFTGELPSGTKQILDAKGPEGLAKWVQEQKEVLLTDTTFRDAHQSLFATRLRTADMLRVIRDTAGKLPELFSFECWGGATFDVAYRFLDESPWQRLQAFKEAAPNVLFQMLLRGANAVGYTSYPDNVVKEFIRLSAKNGVDVFRIFDSLNSLDNMRLSIEAVRECNKVAEPALCYTGDILDPERDKYNLKYFVDMAKELERAGANIIAIKDMAGLLKPQAAYELISAMKDAVTVPIHLHSHEGSGNTIYTYARAIDAGVDIVDVAMSAMSNGTSQPSAASLYYALEGHPRQPKLSVDALNEFSRYWETIRPYYKAADKTENFPNPETYIHEMPGGQYTNLKQQAAALGLLDRWEDIKDMYHRVSMMFGDLIKVTPSSKVVGDMTLYMVQNEITEEDVYANGDTMDFPKSVIEFFEGRIGTPYGGFPKRLQKIVLKGKEPITQRPGAVLPPVDFEEVRKKLENMNAPTTDEAVSSYCLYPDVFKQWVTRCEEYGDVSVLDTPTFFFGMTIGEEVDVEIEKGKVVIIKLIHISEPNENGKRTVSFEFNGMPRELEIFDKNVKTENVARKKADKSNPGEVGATLSGSVVKLMVEKGQSVTKGTPLLVTEAMKMETTIAAPIGGIIGQIHVQAGSRIESGDCLLEIDSKN